MIKFNETKLIDQSKKNFKSFLNRQKRSLITYTNNPNLEYIPDENLKKFKLDPINNKFYIPLSYFLYNDIDENTIMFHIYYELSNYSDWIKNADKYLHIDKYWKIEIDSLASFFLKKVKSEHLEDDPAYSNKVISSYIKKEMRLFLYTIYKYIGFLKLMQFVPLYRNPYEFEKIKEYMKKNVVNQELILSYPKHRAFSESFLYIELFKTIATIDRVDNNPFYEKVFNTNYYDFISNTLVSKIIEFKDINYYNPFIKSFIYPTFEKLFKEEIAEIKLQSSKSKNKDKSKSSDDLLQDDSYNYNDDFKLNNDDIEEILEKIIEDNEKIKSREQMNASVLNLKLKNISRDEERLFNHYVLKTQKQRNEMEKFWMKLIGDMKKETNIRKIEQLKGKLDVPSFIKHYPDFLEAEKDGNYKKLPIFSKYILSSKDKVLPDRIEVSFLIDNSGSMNESKIEAARNTLTLTLLSLNDFNDFLKSNSKDTKVLSECYFFASKSAKIKKFDYSDKSKEMEDIIKSIVKLNGSSGATDDAKSLLNILNSISKKDERDLSNGKLIKIIFEITDGASSFPGLMKNNIKKLLEKNVELYAFQIGKNNDKSKNTFNFIWNEDFTYPHGVIVGEDIDKLPDKLLNILSKNMNNIFK